VSFSSRNLLPSPDEPVSVLLVNLSADDEAALCQILAHPNWQLHGSASCKQALEYLQGHQVPIVVCERDQADGNWQDLLNGAQELDLPSSLIVCSHLADEYLWAEVLNLCGCDVLAKPFENHEVLRAAYIAWQSWKRRRSETVRRAKSRSVTVPAEQPLVRARAATASGEGLPE
jgi:DNA-binding NtrC family response regulator